jgi:hypothetical protein
MGTYYQEGKISMPFNFDGVDKPQEGLVGIKEGYKWGFSDYFGNLQIAPKFDAVTPFEQNRAMVRSGSRWFMLDPQGRQTIKGDWDFAQKVF